MKRNLLLLFGIMLLAACKTPQDVAYLQDIQPGITIQTQVDGTIRFQPGDKLSIIVHSRDPQLMNLFNISNVNSANGSSHRYYSVDSNGQIDFPVLGLLSIKGMSREEVARTIKYQIIAGNLCNDPVVIVEFANMTYSVLGEVKRPGEVQIDKDQITILEALSKAGDLDIQGMRKIKVLRQEGGNQTPYEMDLTNVKSVYSSPAYYIRQHDVVMVEPNEMRKRQTTATGSSSYTPGFWMSIASFVASMVILITK